MTIEKVELDKASFAFAYQPIVNALNRKVTAHELLLREYSGRTINDFLAHPDLFLEHTHGLVIGAAKVAKTILLKHGVETIWVNFTPEQVAQKDFMTVLEAFYRQGIPPSSIAIEVTEQSYDKDNCKFYSNLKDARNIGHPIVIDDFGSGFSNFNHIHDLRPSIVKTDMTILHAATADRFSLDFLRNLVHFIRSVHCKVVIEGIENESHLHIASLCRADYLQGYYFGRPVLLNNEEYEHFDVKNELNKSAQLIFSSISI